MFRKLLVATVALAILLAGCTPGKTTMVTFEQLFSDPGKYNGKEITIEGFFFAGFETIVLAERLEPSGYAPGHLVPKGDMLWVEGSVPREIYDRLQQQQMMGPTERFGKLRIKGTFQYGGKYGHLGGFNSQIVPKEVELVPWSPS